MKAAKGTILVVLDARPPLIEINQRSGKSIERNLLAMVQYGGPEGGAPMVVEEKSVMCLSIAGAAEANSTIT
jgi:hypothetical protein